MTEDLTSQQKLEIIIKCIDYGAGALHNELVGYLNEILNLANNYLASQVKTIEEEN